MKINKLKIMKFSCLIALLCISLTYAKQTIDLTAYAKQKYETPVTVKVGEMFEVLLKENPSTGYKWIVLDTLLEKSGLTKVLKNSHQSFKQDENRRGAVGVGGTRSLEFEILS